MITCPACKGMKKVPTLGMMSHKTCEICKGAGKVKKEEFKAANDFVAHLEAIEEVETPSVTIDYTEKKKPGKPSKAK